MLAKTRYALEKEPHHVSTVALRLDEDEWVMWLPDLEHPLFDKFKRMQVESFAHDYEVQKALLNKLCDKRNTGFVASYKVTQDPDSGQLRTYTTWTAGITSWLPKTDMIGFANIRDIERGICDCCMYDWDQVVQGAGHLLKSLDMYPPWYEVTEFPTDEEFEAIGEPLIPQGTVEMPPRDPVPAEHLPLNQTADDAVEERGSPEANRRLFDWVTPTMHIDVDLVTGEPVDAIMPDGVFGFKVGCNDHVVLLLLADRQIVKGTKADMLAEEDGILATLRRRLPDKRDGLDTVEVAVRNHDPNVGTLIASIPVGNMEPTIKTLCLRAQ